MRSFTKFVLGSLLGGSLVLTGTAATAQAKDDNCLLVVCVDAPILGPIVGTIGDSLEEVLTPNKPPVVPPVTPPGKPPVVPPVQPPGQPPGNPSQPVAPPVQPQPVTPADSGNETVEAPAPEVVQPTPTPSASPSPSPTPSPEDHSILLPDEHDSSTFGHVDGLTPFIVGVLGMLLLVLAGMSAVRFVRSLPLRGYRDTSVLPRDMKPRD